MQKIRLGILIREFVDLTNLELRIYDKLLKSEYCEIVLLIKDGRQKIKKNFFRFLNINIFAKIIFILINKIDNYFFDTEFLSFYNKKEVIENLLKIELISIFPIKKNFVDFFDDNECAKLIKYNLDLILRNEFGIIKGKILTLPKYGIWSFHHGDNDRYRGGPAGFWEVLNNDEITGVTLQILNNDLDGGNIVEKGYYPTQQTFIRNNNFILEKSIIILIKNLKLLYFNQKIITQKSKEYKFKIYKYPTNLLHVLQYLLVILKNIVLSKIIKKYYYIKKYRLNMWSLFYIDNDIFSKSLSNIYMIKPPKGYFYADPFAISYDNKEYIFFENYSYNEQKGKITCGILKNNNLTNLKDILVSEKHFSYPHVFHYNNSVFLIPECYQSNRLEVYKSTNFPYEWKLFSTAFEGEIIADPTILHYNNELWLFLNKSDDQYKDLSSELYIYKIFDLKLNKITPHKKNPVIIDSRYARNAGNFFTRNNKIYRPSQSNIKSAYGYSINISEITKLSLEEYEEKIIKKIEPNFFKGIKATHHLTFTKNAFIVDGCFDHFK